MEIGIGLGLTLGGRVPTYTAEAIAAFAAMSVQPSVPLKSLYDACIVSLKAAGVWTKLDALYLMNVETAQAARLNIKNPGTYNLTATSSPTFTAKVGYAGDGAAAYLNTNFNPTTASSPNFTQNSAHVSVWSLKSGTDAAPAFGMAGSGNTGLYPKFTDNKAYGQINEATSGANVAVADGLGHYIANRSAAGAEQLYKNGSSIATAANASASPANAVLAVFRLGSSFFNGGAAMATVGPSLTAQEASDLYTALNTFKTGVDAL